MQEQTKKDLFKALDKLKNEIVYSRKDLNRFNSEKESWFNKKTVFSNKIREKIKIIKENKTKRDALTKKVKELKEQRTVLSQETRKKISKFKRLNDAKKSLFSKSKIKDISALKTEIDRTEVKLETEAMPFEHEKKLSKKLKALKKSLEESSELIEIMGNLKRLNLEINSSKRNTDEIHNQIQITAKESQVLHELILKFSKETDDLKPKEREAFKNFIESKKKYLEINNKLKEKLSEMSNISEKINKFKLEEEEKRKLKETMLIKSKEHEFEEKFRHGKKITTEDFL